MTGIFVRVREADGSFADKDIVQLTDEQLTEFCKEQQECAGWRWVEALVKAYRDRLPWIVVWDYGSCNDGSHSSGYIGFKTEAEARAKVAEEIKLAKSEGGHVTLIRGWTLEHHACDWGRVTSSYA